MRPLTLLGTRLLSSSPFSLSESLGYSLSVVILNNFDPNELISASEELSSLTATGNSDSDTAFTIFGCKTYWKCSALEEVIFLCYNTRELKLKFSITN